MNSIGKFGSGFLLGMLIVWTAGFFGPKDFYSVRVIDNSKCENPEYVLHTSFQTIEITEEQISRDSALSPNGYEAYFFVTPIFNGSKEFTYKIKASYSNCPSIESEERIVQRGWLLYEAVYQGTFTYSIRAK